MAQQPTAQGTSANDLAHWRKTTNLMWIHLGIWFFFGFVFSVGNLAYALLQSHYAGTLAGRVNTALNLMVFVGAFGIQWGFGAMVDALQAAGQPLHAAYQTSFGGLLVLQVLSWFWFLGGTRK